MLTPDVNGGLPKLPLISCEITHIHTHGCIAQSKHALYYFRVCERNFPGTQTVCSCILNIIWYPNALHTYAVFYLCSICHFRSRLDNSYWLVLMEGRLNCCVHSSVQFNMDWKGKEESVMMIRFASCNTTTYLSNGHVQYFFSWPNSPKTRVTFAKMLRLYRNYITHIVHTSFYKCCYLSILEI